MKKTTTFIFVMLALIVSTTGYAQQPTAITWDAGGVPQEEAANFADKMLKNSPFVFDAKVLEKKVYEDEKGDNFTNRIVEIVGIRRNNSGKKERLSVGDTILIVHKHGCIIKGPVPIATDFMWSDIFDCDGYGRMVPYKGGEVGNLSTYFCTESDLPPYKGYLKDYRTLKLYHEVWGAMTVVPDQRISGIIAFLKKGVIFENYMSSYQLELKEKKSKGVGDATERTLTIDTAIKFNKRVVAAGMDDTLTITYEGNTGGFGSLRGELFFKDADGQGYNLSTNTFEFTEFPCDSMDIIEWTNNKIVVNIPSFIIGDNPNVPHGCPGSGEIKIQPHGSTSSMISQHKIMIKYSAVSTPSPIIENGTIVGFKKSRDYLGIFKCRQSVYKVVAHTSLTTQQKQVLWAACRNWNKTLGVNIFSFDENITTSDISHTNLSIVSLGDESKTASSGVIAYPDYYFSKSFSMSLRAENTMYDTAYYNTAKQLYEYTQPQTNNNTSFYVTCLHELGHAIGIGHAEYYNQTQEPFDIHYFLQHNPGTLLPSQRRVLTSGYGQPIEAARKIIADSRKISWQINGGSSRSLGEIIPSTTCLVYDYNNAVSDTEKASVTKSSEPEQNVVYQWQFKNNTTFPNWTNIPIPAAGATTTFNKFGINSSNKNEVYLTGFSTYPQGTKLRCQTTVTPCDCEAGASSTVTSQEIAVIRKDTTFRLDFFTICITPSNQDSTFTINTGTPTGGTYEIEDCLGCVFNSNQFIPSKVGVGEWTLIYRANCQEYRLPRGLIIADDCLNVNGKSYFFDGLYQRKNTNHVQDMCLKPQSYKFKAHYSFMGNTPADVLSVFVSNPNGVFGGTAIVVGTKSIAAGSYLRGDISCSYTFPQTGTYKFRLFVPSSGGYAFDLYNNPNYGINVTISPDGLCPTLSLPVAKDGGQNADEPTLGITNGQETTVVVLDETVQKTAATAEQVIQRMVMIYPNPTRTGQVTVDFVDIMPTDVATVSIYDILGRKISEQVLSERNTLFDLGNQPSGTYILMLNVNGSVSGHKVVVQQ